MPLILHHRLGIIKWGKVCPDLWI